MVFHVDLRGSYVDMGRQQGLILHDQDGLICSHGAHFPNRKFGTLWSVVGKPGDRSIDVVSGYPCQNRYETVVF